MQTKLLKLIIFIAIAAAAIFILNFISSGSSDEIGIEELSNPEAEKLKTTYDSLKLSEWDLKKYNALKSRLMAFKSQDVIGMSDAILLEEYLDLTYAQVMEKAVEKWRATDGNSADSELLREMESISRNPKCAPLISDEIEIMRCYFRALNIPSRVSSFTKQQFSDKGYTDLMNEIASNCRRAEIKHFGRLAGIAKTQQSELNDFKAFAQTVGGSMELYNMDKKDFDAIERVKSLCPDKNPYTKKYLYYAQMLSGEEVCD